MRGLGNGSAGYARAAHTASSSTARRARQARSCRPSRLSLSCSVADMFVSAIAAACGVAAYLAGMPAIAMSAIAIGIFGDLMIGRGVAPSTAELVVGAGLVAAGAACLLQERWSA
jgi:hypothetical protein